MSKILKGVKGLFFKEVPTGDPEEEEEEEEKRKETPPAEHTQSFEAQWTQEDLPDGEVNEKFLEILLQHLNQANLSGYDYLEYRKALLSLSEMNMSESQRYQSAFVMAQTMNADLHQLQESIQHYLDTLSTEESQFVRSFQKQQGKKLGQQHERIQVLEQSLKLKTEQIKILQKEIQEDQEQLTQAQEALSKESTRLTSVKSDFMASLEHIRNQILSDREKIQLHLRNQQNKE